MSSYQCRCNRIAIASYGELRPQELLNQCFTQAGRGVIQFWRATLQLREGDYRKVEVTLTLRSGHAAGLC
jgi:hypothetical protein